MPLIETEEAARRRARAMASDLAIYNAEAIRNGIANDNLFVVMAGEVEEKRAFYKGSVTPQLYAKNFFDRALVDVLVREQGHIPSKMW